MKGKSVRVMADTVARVSVIKGKFLKKPMVMFPFPQFRLGKTAYT